MNQEDLLDLKQEINKAKEKKAGLLGRKEILVEQLKARYGVSTPAKASAKLQSMEQEIESMDDEIQEATEKLEEQLNEQDTDTEE
jgi:hypothetical protein